MRFLIILLIIILIGCSTLSKNDLIISYVAENARLKLEVTMWQGIAESLRRQLQNCETEEDEPEVALSSK